MKVVPIAQTFITTEGWKLFTELGFEPELFTKDSDTLAEFSGRLCYESYHKPNPETAENKSYIGKNLIGKSHESVFEHATVSFYVSGVSRNLLLELERHRHLSLSVISTRYVNPGKMSYVVHPNTPPEYLTWLEKHDENSRELASEIFQSLIDKGMLVKEAREVARQVLPGNLETKFVVTGNMRAWRYVINLRNHESADKEIQLFASEILTCLKKVAPSSFQDM